MKASRLSAGTRDAVAKLAAACPQLPRAYLDFLRISNGAEGLLGVDPGWFVVWGPEDVLELSEGYGLPEYLPGYFAFGSNGGGELLVFRMTGADGHDQVFMVPAVGMAESELLPVAGSFAEFVEQMGKTTS